MYSRTTTTTTTTTSSSGTNRGGGGGGDSTHRRSRSSNSAALKQAKKAALKDLPPWGSRSVDEFQKIKQIGEGTYGRVYMAKNKTTEEVVALKKIRMANEKEGFPITAIREIKILKQLNHDNVVKLKEIVVSKKSKEDYTKGKGGIYMVFEYMQYDLTGLIEQAKRLSKPFTEQQIKCYMKQLLEGLYYCHSNNVLHRDIKGSNLLINSDGELKLADFGLARPYNKSSGSYTNLVITLWYRPPELLLGATQYGPEVDMWSVGCILGELLARKAIFPGRTDPDQLEIIFKACGSPTSTNWPDLINNPDKYPFSHLLPTRRYPRRLRELFSYFSPNARNLLDALLTLDPSKRLTAEQALDHDWFWTNPMPVEKSDLPKFPPMHEFQVKKRHRQQREKQKQLASSSSSSNIANSTNPHHHHHPNSSQHSSSSSSSSSSLSSTSRFPPPGGVGAVGMHHRYQKNPSHPNKRPKTFHQP